MKLYLAAIHSREEVLAEIGRKAERQNAESQESRDHLDPVPKTQLQQALITVADVFERMFETALEAGQRIAAGLGVTGLVSRDVGGAVAQQIYLPPRDQHR